MQIIAIRKQRNIYALFLHSAHFPQPSSVSQKKTEVATAFGAVGVALLILLIIKSRLLHDATKANPSKPLCGTFSAEIWSEITSVNKDKPFLSCGSDQPLIDVTGKHPVEHLYNSGSGYGNCFNMQATMGGEMPSDSKNGDKVYVIVVFHGGFAGYIVTAYEYQWHVIS